MPSDHHEDQVGTDQDSDDDRPFSQLTLQVPEACTMRLVYSTGLRHVPMMAVSTARELIKRKTKVKARHYPND
jgi:hypothetical protein